MPMTVDPLAHTPFSYEYNPQSLLTPYAYQQQLIDALVASVSIARSGDCLLIVLATGGGKNLVSNEFVANVIQEGKRVLRSAPPISARGTRGSLPACPTWARAPPRAR